MLSARFLSAMLFGALTLSASATPPTAQQLTAQLSTLLNKQQPGGADFPVVRSVKILTPTDKLERLCARPVLALAGSDTRLTGNRSIAARCGTERAFIQIAVQAEGSWWSTVAPLKAGATLSLADIQRHQGSLDHLPVGLLFAPNEIVGRVTTRNIAAGAPVTENMLRKQWRVRAGQDVEVIAIGNGFTVRAQGKALDNAAINEKLRVSMRTRQVTTGVVTAEGAILIDLK